MIKYHNLPEITELVKNDPLNYAKELCLEETLFSKNGYKSQILELNGCNVVFFDTDREIIDTGKIVEDDGDVVYIKRSDDVIISWPVVDY
jgi:hypothetical protein